MKLSSRIAFNTFSQVASRILVILLSLLTTAFLARILGSAGYGNYVFITSFVLIFVGLSDLGTNTIGVREASLNQNRRQVIFSSILIIRLVVSLILFLGLNLAVSFLPQFAGLREPAFWGSLVLLFLIFRTISQGALQSLLRLELAASLEIFASILFLAFILILLALRESLSLSWLMIFCFISALLSGLLGLVITARFLPLRPLFDQKEIFRLFKEALPLGAYFLIFSVYDRGIDSFIIKTFFSSDAVGFYGLAYKIHGNLILGAAFLMNSLFPLLSSLQGKPEGLKRTYEKTFTVLLLAGLAILGGGLILAPWVIRLVAGSNFSPSILVLRILLGATFFSYLNHLTGFLMVALGKQKQLLGFSLIAFSINLILNLLFIPKFSFLAAAVITVLTELTILLFTQNFLVKKFGLKYSYSVFQENLKGLLLKRQHYFDSL